MLRLDEINTVDSHSVGAKAASLARIRRCGLRVPDAMVIDNRWFHLFMERAELTDKVELLEKIVWSIRWEHLRKVSEEITARMRSVSFPEEFEQSLIDALRDNQLDNATLVCRSSSSIEDSDQAAFPGIFHTTLDVFDLEDLKRAIVACYSSLFETRVLKYLLSRRPLNASMRMAVIVQRQVECEASGVAFSRSPTDPHDSAVIIEAGAGRAEELVSGKEMSFRYRVDNDGRCELVALPVGDFRAPELISRNALASGFPVGDAKEPWASAQRLIFETGEIDRARDPPSMAFAMASSPLDQRRAVRVANICRQLRTVWGQEVDVEFAFAKTDDEPYVLQCRPITATMNAGETIVPRRHLSGRMEHGIACADGFVEGTGFDYRQFSGDVAQLEDKVLLVDGLSTDDYDAVFTCRGIVSQRHDSQLNHVSIACRELGIPYIAAVENACRDLDGRHLALDGGTGSVWVMPDGAPGAARNLSPAKPGCPPLSSAEVGYLPLLDHDNLAAEITFRGLDLFLIGLAHQTTSKAELEAAFVERLDQVLARHPFLTLRLPPPSLSAMELAVLHECIPGINLTIEELGEWIVELVKHVQHRNRVLLF